MAFPDAIGEIAVRGRVAELDRGGDADVRETRQVGGIGSCVCSMRWRRSSGRQTEAVASKASSAARLAASPIACTPTGQPASAASLTISASRSLEVISSLRIIHLTHRVYGVGGIGRTTRDPASGRRRAGSVPWRHGSG